jgi:DnaJ-class molecular chaperone
MNARDNSLTEHLFDMASRMNRAAAEMYAPKPCDHCRGTGTVATYNPNGTKPCFACEGTGGPRRYRMAYNIHRG